MSIDAQYASPAYPALNWNDDGVALQAWNGVVAYTLRTTVSAAPAAVIAALDGAGLGTTDPVGTDRRIYRGSSDERGKRTIVHVRVEPGDISGTLVRLAVWTEPRYDRLASKQSLSLTLQTDAAGAAARIAPAATAIGVHVTAEQTAVPLLIEHVVTAQAASIALHAPWVRLVVRVAGALIAALFLLSLVAAGTGSGVAWNVYGLILLVLGGGYWALRATRRGRNRDPFAHQRRRT